MHTGDPCQLGFEMEKGAKVWIFRAQISEGAPKQCEQLRLVMVGLCADLD